MQPPEQRAVDDLVLSLLGSLSVTNGAAPLRLHVLFHLPGSQNTLHPFHGCFGFLQRQPQTLGFQLTPVEFKDVLHILDLTVIGFNHHLNANSQAFDLP